MGFPPTFQELFLLLRHKPRETPYWHYLESTHSFHISHLVWNIKFDKILLWNHNYMSQMSPNLGANFL